MDGSELLIAGICNMSCRYCYIPKNDSNISIHQKAIDCINDGTYLEYLIELYGDDLRHLEFWGTEPSLSLAYITPYIKEIFARFHKLESIAFSTNLLQNPMAIVDMAKEIDKQLMMQSQSTVFKLKIQISLDGPECITDRNRHNKATEKIIRNYEELLLSLGELYNPKIINIHFKPTITIENIVSDLSTVDGVKNWFYFFDDLIDRANNTLGIKVPPATPTFVVPGKYTSDEGVLAKQFFQRISYVNRENFEGALFRHYKQLNNYVGRYIKLVRMNDRISYNLSSLTCSGGNNSFAVDPDGKLCICHRMYFEENKEDNHVIKKHLVKIGDKENINRMELVYRGYNFLNYFFDIVYVL